MRRWVAAVLFVTVGCSMTQTSHSSGDHPMRVGEAGPCPRSLGNHDGVRNTGSGLSERLVPGTPTALLICRYSPKEGAQAPSVQHGVLYASARLDAPDAKKFADLLNDIPKDHGEHTCPADLSRYDVLAFSIRGRSDVDVWSSSTGCWSFTNGTRTTGTSSPALAAYMQRLQQVAPGQLDVRAGADGAHGTIRGRLLASGVATFPVPGKVMIQPGDVTIDVAGDGTFAVELAPGTYTLTGRSPQYGDGRGMCRADAAARVASGQTLGVNVYCVEK